MNYIVDLYIVDSQTTWKNNYKIYKIKTECINGKVAIESYIKIECRTCLIYFIV